MKKALITGITGQDGSYLAEFLLAKGYEVHGIIRRASNFNTNRIDHVYQDPHEADYRLVLHYGDLTDTSNLNRILEKVQPVEIYNLAAQSHVQVSFQVPEYTAEVDAVGTLRFLDAIKDTGIDTRFYQASTSELYGKTQQVPQNEDTPFHPRSPYAVAKLYAYWITINYREAYQLHASNGILFNHESPRRGETFVSRKITRAVTRMMLGLQDCLFVGNLKARRDWGYAPEYVDAMWRILQQKIPGDYVISTGESHSVQEFIEATFAEAGMTLEWQGNGESRHAIITKIKATEKFPNNVLARGKTVVRIDPRYYRPAEVDMLVGDSSRAAKILGWKAKVSFHELVAIMVDSDYQHAAKEKRVAEVHGS